MKWRLVENEPYSAAMNMAIDHAIYESVANQREAPTIRFYNWSSPSVSIGAYQNPKEINLELCKEKCIDVVRRMTGGRAVYHDKADFTYSVIAHIRMFDYSIKKAYSEVCTCIINALSEFGINAALENKNDIIVEGKKISGNAAKTLDKGVYLQHGTLIYDINHSLMSEVLNLSQELIKEKATSVLEHKKATQEEVYNALKKGFTLNKNFKAGELSKYELMRAKDLVNTRYKTIILPKGTLLRNKGACYIERGS